MVSRLVFCDAERAVPSLSRGWRTPDPSPTRSAVGLPKCKPSELGLCSDAKVPTPRYDAAGLSQWKGSSSAGSDRTPSPPIVSCGRRGRIASASSKSESQARSMSPPTTSSMSKSQTRSPSPHRSYSSAQFDQESGPVLEVISPDDVFAVSHMWPIPMITGDPMCVPCVPEQWLSAMQPSMILTPFIVESPSIGSLGHPFQCAEACKYLNKKRGCKDGTLCDRCHLCEWKSSKGKKNGSKATW